MSIQREKLTRTPIIRDENGDSIMGVQVKSVAEDSGRTLYEGEFAVNTDVLSDTGQGTVALTSFCEEITELLLNNTLGHLMVCCATLLNSRAGGQFSPDLYAAVRTIQEAIRCDFDIDKANTENDDEGKDPEVVAAIRQLLKSTIQ